ncbi:response regulator [Mesorhizobium sp. 8]|uniref:response regulator n=1 Tax=Mesorhizobium sp. 8 TaxID=2584466 RepID=UPI0011248455|nr:response regulator [Mesorhizobium sp. 8]QDC03298.1 response regulator [Mesorhizobium sp. 8]
MSSFDNDNAWATGHETSTRTDFSKVLVVARSPINRIVVAKIVERAGLKPIAEPPETAEKALRMQAPGTVVLDGGPDNRDCDALMAGIAAARTAGRHVPAVILLSNRVGTPESLDLPGVVDAVVAKPITPECLQPVIDRLATLGRG